MQSAVHDSVGLGRQADCVSQIDRSTNGAVLQTICGAGQDHAGNQQSLAWTAPAIANASRTTEAEEGEGGGVRCDLPRDKANAAQGEAGRNVTRRKKMRFSVSQLKKAGITANALYDKYDEQQHRCKLSGRYIDENTMSLDHVVPRARLGEETLENLQWVHEQINSAKGTMSQQDFIAMCCEVADWTRRKA